METQSEVLKRRTKSFAIKIIRLFRSLPRTEEARIIGRQLLRAATSVAANYRAVRRARSRSEFIAKMGIVVEEADESAFWIELLGDVGLVKGQELEPHLKEANELLAIFAASHRTARRNRS